MLNPLGEHQAWYDTIAEFTWIMTLIGVPFVVFAERKEEYAVMPVMAAGILIYLMLFESGARYVYVFLPMFIVMSACGIDAAAVRFNIDRFFNKEI
jgi:lipopolysaccharide export LptBFGC system permease protein LptF